MGEALENQPAEDFPVPDGVVFVRVNRDTGAPIAAGGSGGFFESFKEGRQPSPDQPQGGAPGDKPKSFLQSESFGAPSESAPVQPPVSPGGQDAPGPEPNR